jgi:hypothetical protein
MQARMPEPAIVLPDAMKSNRLNATTKQVAGAAW